MTKTLIQSGPCRFETRVTAERVAKRKVKVTVETQCPNMQKMFAGWVAENGDELDPYKFCMSRPGQDALHTYAAAHLPPPRRLSRPGGPATHRRSRSRFVR